MPPDQPRWTEYLPLRDLKPHPDNPKAHDIAGLQASMRRFGYVEQVILDDRTGLLLGGHGRTEALARLEAEGGDPPEGVTVGDDGAWRIPVGRGYDSRDDDEALALLLALNRHVEAGGWLTDPLSEALDRLDAGPGLEGTGFMQADIDDLIAQAAEQQAAALDSWQTSTPDEDRDRYQASGVRGVILYYGAGDYEQVIDQLAKARADLGVETNAAVLRHFLDGAYPHAPAD